MSEPNDDKAHWAAALSEMSGETEYSAQIAQPIVPEIHIDEKKYQAVKPFTIRRTLIPILLVNGLLWISLGAMWFMLGENSPLLAVGRAIPICVGAGGVVMLFTAVFNMLSLRNALQVESSR